MCDTGSRECTLFEKYYVLLTSLAAKETNTSFWDNPAYLYNAMQSDSTGKPDIACTASHQCVPWCFVWACARALRVTPSLGACIHCCWAGTLRALRLLRLS